jgi:uncharacterized membrane protein YeaQ/YmgE (transglycosylase-associated protein family)
MDVILFGKLLVWALVGWFIGSLAGRLATRQREGYGRWANLFIGMLGAVIGGLVFGWLGIDFGLAAIQVSLADLLAALLGSFICIGAWALWRRRAGARPCAAPRWASAGMRCGAGP